MPTRNFKVSAIVEACRLKIEERDASVEEHRERLIKGAMNETVGRWWWKKTIIRTREEAIEYLKTHICDYYLRPEWDVVNIWYPIGETKKLMNMAKANHGGEYMSLDQKDFERLAPYLEKVD